jgi:hypothetical protein
VASEQALEDAILRLVAERGQGKSICPSEAARAVGGPKQEEWNRLMGPVRRIAIRLADQGQIVILRKGKPVDPHEFRGVYRLALPPDGIGA